MKAPRFWSNVEECIHTEAVVREYPRQDGEGALTYIERLAILSGLMKPEDRLGIELEGITRGAEPVGEGEK